MGAAGAEEARLGRPCCAQGSVGEDGIPQAHCECVPFTQGAAGGIELLQRLAKGVPGGGEEEGRHGAFLSCREQLLYLTLLPGSVRLPLSASEFHVLSCVQVVERPKAITCLHKLESQDYFKMFDFGSHWVGTGP